MSFIFQKKKKTIEIKLERSPVGGAGMMEQNTEELETSTGDAGITEQQRKKKEDDLEWSHASDLGKTEHTRIRSI